MTVTLKQLEIFHAIVVAGSISQATRSVGLSQPTLSQQLARLEETLGTQLLVRGRTASVNLTAAGEFWFRKAAGILGAVDQAEQQHRVLFDEKNLTLRFGTTPSLRGRFTEVAAQAALEIDQIARFDFVWATTSSEVVEQINTHKLNCGVVSVASVEAYRSSFHLEHLWRDHIVWVVPKDVPDDVIARARDAGLSANGGHEALSRHVDIILKTPWSDWSEDWYRNRLPFASPFFGCMTYPAAVDIVATGAATCHSPMSLLPNLPESVRRRIKAVDLGECTRDVVLVMPKHLLSLKPFKTFCDTISAFARQTYGAGAQLGHRRRPVIPGLRAQIDEELVT